MFFTMTISFWNFSTRENFFFGHQNGQKPCFSTFFGHFLTINEFFRHQNIDFSIFKLWSEVALGIPKNFGKKIGGICKSSKNRIQNFYSYLVTSTGVVRRYPSIPPVDTPMDPYNTCWGAPLDGPDRTPPHDPKSVPTVSNHPWGSSWSVPTFGTRFLGPLPSQNQKIEKM